MRAYRQVCHNNTNQNIHLSIFLSGGIMTVHQLINTDSCDLSFIKDGSIDLIVTSPPYPMISMWDELFINEDQSIRDDLEKGDGLAAFDKMHTVLNKIWSECNRVLKDNGFVCINTGDATRSAGGIFQLFPNHVKITNYFLSHGYLCLPDIIWRKPSNSPTKFMGSGMYPAGAYVTYEHEHILIFKKNTHGCKRVFSQDEKQKRARSAYFWEERNLWFSDLWTINGTSQQIQGFAGRKRNASFPFEIPYRLINMYSIEGDTVLDPFCGLGTTNLACIVSGRNSIGVDKDSSITELARERLNVPIEVLNNAVIKRLDDHLNFLSSCGKDKDKMYSNPHLGCKVITKQETEIVFQYIEKMLYTDNGKLYCEYSDIYPSHHI